MLTKEDLQLLSEMMDKKFDEKLNPINERLGKIETRLNKVEEEIAELKYDMRNSIGKINMISEWCEAATKYHIREIHYPLDPEEKLG